MRISTDKNDIGYRYWLPNYDLVITLDGVAVSDCDLADEELGFVRVASKNAEGHLYCIGDEIATEVKRGVVSITLPLGVDTSRDALPVAYYARLPFEFRGDKL